MLIRKGAEHNRAHFDKWGITVSMLASSPGAGKTVLLEQTRCFDELKKRCN